MAGLRNQLGSVPGRSVSHVVVQRSRPDTRVVVHYRDLTENKAFTWTFELWGSGYPDSDAEYTGTLTAPLYLAVGREAVAARTEAEADGLRSREWKSRTRGSCARFRCRRPLLKDSWRSELPRLRA